MDRSRGIYLTTIHELGLRDIWNQWLSYNLWVGWASLKKAKQFCFHGLVLLSFLTGFHWAWAGHSIVLLPCSSASVWNSVFGHVTWLYFERSGRREIIFYYCINMCYRSVHLEQACRANLNHKVKESMFMFTLPIQSVAVFWLDIWSKFSTPTEIGRYLDYPCMIERIVSDWTIAWMA